MLAQVLMNKRPPVQRLQGSKVSPLPLPTSTPAHGASTPPPVLAPTLPPLKRPSVSQAQLVARLPIVTRGLSITPAADQSRRQRTREALMSLIGRLHRANAEGIAAEEDPWRHMLERALPGNVTCTSTVALLGLLDFPVTTGNARRLARTMRAMGWVGIKSRKLPPGGWRSTECRGWSRAVRQTKVRPPSGHVEIYQDERVQ